MDPGNYRPVSFLNVVSKILERAVHSQLDDYLGKRAILFENQSGFRGGYSTDSCLIGLSDFVKQELGNGSYVGMVLIDLQKAFDTVDHCILIEKLRAIGVNSTTWFESYLTGRSQCVQVGNSQSEFVPITCGVPQGSILGPQLFLIYINDMSISLNCKLSLYADDSALLFAHKSASFIADRLSSELTRCKQWLVDNKLSLHVGKTESLLFGKKTGLKKVKEFRVLCEGTAVKRVSHVKYLGVHLDENMSGSLHAMHVLKTCASRLAFLYRNASLLDFQSRKLLCSALIQPYLDYCCSSWYSGLSTQLTKRLDVFQRKMIRFIFSFDSRRHVGNRELRTLLWLNVPDRTSFFKLVHLFRIRHDLAPKYLASNFTLVSQNHSYATRDCNLNFFLSKVLASAPTSFAFTGIKQWNSLPKRIKEIASVMVFKSKLKEYLLSRYD